MTLLCSNLFVAVTTSYSVFTLERFPEDPTLTMVGIFIAHSLIFTLYSFVFSVKNSYFVGLISFVPNQSQGNLFDDSNVDRSQYANVLDVAFLVFPPYCLGKGFVDLTYKYVMKVIFESMGIKANGKFL